jgi:hypothetical protein
MEEITLNIEEVSDEDAGAVTRVVREMLRTPSFKELVKIWISTADREKAKGFVNTVLWEDFEFTLSLMSVFPELINYMVEALLEMSTSLEQLPSELLDTFVISLFGRIDTDRMKEIPGAYFPILEKINFQEKLSAEIDRVVTESDYGKAREVLEEQLETWTAGTARVLEKMLDNPVIIANLVGMVPPLGNYLINVLSVLFGKLEMPSEILASALFNTMSALDAEELGRALSGLFGQINLLHAGNIVLGGDEPYFRGVFNDFTRRMLDNLDTGVASGAISALGEDLEVIAGVLIEQATRDPERLLPLAPMVASLMNSVFRIFSNALAEWTALPDETLREVSMAFHEKSEAVEIGRTIDLFITLALRLREANPEIQGERLAEGLEVINTERLELLIRGMAGDVKRAALANPGIKMTLQPEEMGKRANEIIVGLNRAAGPAAVRDYVVEMMSVMDARELGLLLTTIAGGVIEGIFAKREMALEVIKTVMSSTFKVVGHMFKFVFKRG